MKRLLEEIIATHTKQELEKVGKDMERDYFMTAQEALDYGIIDTVIAQSRHACDGGCVLVSRAISRYKVERHGPSDRR